MTNSFKSLFTFYIFCGFIVGCTSNSDNTNTAIETVAKDTVALKDTIAVVPNPLPAADNSYNALDWPGTYSGTLPCADCEGIETTISLSKSLQYTKTTKYLGKKNDKLFKVEGTFSWNKEGSIITLKGIEDAPAQYLVGENNLFQLDKNGNRITGGSAIKYQLRKN